MPSVGCKLPIKSSPSPFPTQERSSWGQWYEQRGVIVQEMYTEGESAVVVGGKRVAGDVVGRWWGGGMWSWRGRDVHEFGDGGGRWRGCGREECRWR